MSGKNYEGRLEKMEAEINEYVAQLAKAKERITELEAALRPLVDKFDDQASDDEWFPFEHKYARQAAAVLKEDYDEAQKAD